MARINGQDCTITITPPGALSSWKDWEWSEEASEQEALSGNTAFHQFLIGPKKATLKVSGWEDSVQGFAELAGVGVNVTVSFAGDGPDNIADYGQACVMNCSMKGSTDPTEWSMDISFGRVDA